MQLLSTSLGIIFQYDFHIKVVKKISDIQKVKGKTGKEKITTLMVRKGKKIEKRK